MVFLNGQFVPDELATISVFDRSFLYGDGLFETIRVSQGRPFRWPQHWQRLQTSAERLGIHLPYPEPEFARYLHELIQRHALADALARITVSRGVGARGYSPAGATQPAVVMCLHSFTPAAPSRLPQWSLITSSYRLAPGDPLATLKTCGKLLQVMARAEAHQAHADEALLLNTSGLVAEGASSTVFWIERNTVRTPPLDTPALPGITRAAVLELCGQLQIPALESPCLPATLTSAEGVFMTLSSLGLVEVVSLDGCPLGRSPLTALIHRAYQRLLVEETKNSPCKPVQFPL